LRELFRVTKKNGAVVVFSNGMYTAELMLAGKKHWRYNLIWEKTAPTGFLNAKRMPLRAHEDILVFYRALPRYAPQKTTGHRPVHGYTKHTSDGMNYGRTKIGVSGGGSTERYPRSVLKFPSDKQKEALHPTQKPLALCAFLIKSYTEEGDMILDPFAGSGTVPLAAKTTGRRYTAFEIDKTMYHIAENRLGI
jgi:site-specific DNA-methyltransferase (adenine-specific)